MINVSSRTGPACGVKNERSFPVGGVVAGPGGGVGGRCQGVAWILERSIICPPSGEWGA
jgi:hypothetical protein